MTPFPAGTKYVAGGLFGLWLVCPAAVGMWVILDDSHRMPGWVLPVLLLITAGHAMPATPKLRSPWWWAAAGSGLGVMTNPVPRR